MFGYKSLPAKLSLVVTSPELLSTQLVLPASDGSKLENDGASALHSLTEYEGLNDESA
jgi:hypothetical protein